jgi:limonene-1,2-epoxide hydrolase
MSSTDIIRLFFDAWEARSLDGILELMTPDARWLNVGLPESVGQDAIRKAVAPFLATASSVEVKVRHIAETSDGAVLAERTDIFDNNGKTMSVDVMGVFELKDGKIHAWREYFDTRALAPAS